MKYVIEAADSALHKDAWRRAVTETYFPLDTEYRCKGGFSGSLENWSLGIVNVSKMQCDGVLYRRHQRHFLSEQDSSILITLPELSDVNFSQGSRSTRCSVGSFLVERGDQPYEFWHDNPNSLWVLKVSTSSIRSRIGSTDRIGSLIFDAEQGVASYFVGATKTAIAHIDVMDETAREAAGMHILEMLCLAIKRDDRVLDSSISSIRAAHLRRAEQCIRENLKDLDLTSQSVADACGISLRYLQRLFADSDQSINGFIRENRLTRCAEELAQTTNMISLAEIAYRWGFSDQSQFCKHYKARFGVTPSEARRRSRITSD